MTANEILALTGGVITLVAAISAVIMWYVRVVVRDEVSKATRSIQPGYRNGGESLADVAHMVRRIANQIGLEES